MHGLVGLVLIIIGFSVVEFRVFLEKEAKDEGLPVWQVVGLNALIYIFLVLAHELLSGRIG
jgi:hypothetical protein